MTLLAIAIESALGFGGAFELTVVGGLAVALGLAVWGLRSRSRRGGTEVPETASTPAPMVCPACQREFPAGITFCPADARKLVALASAGERRPSGMHCPRCRRAFESDSRFCPFDAEELVPPALWSATYDHDHGVGHGDSFIHGHAKICPVCAARYGLEATFCGKDGSELATVN
ncbi:MAG: hypothetical protein EXR72_17290 [Myxococcales bacterium]|nr:hypothetical protein [Myxococcales bacterium]